MPDSLSPGEVSSAAGPRMLAIPALGGALAALVAGLPVSLLKTFATLARLCAPISSDAFDHVISLWTCGVFYNTWHADSALFVAYVAFAALGGAASGAAIGNAVIRRAKARPSSGPGSRPPRLFWWGALSGLLFDLIFIFVFLYPGQ